MYRYELVRACDGAIIPGITVKQSGKEYFKRLVGWTEGEWVTLTRRKAIWGI